MKHDKECEMLGGFFQCKCEEREARKPTEWKRVKIAEHRGWRLNMNKHTSAALDWIGPEDQRAYFPPDYFRDLNACREMERGLGDDIDTWLLYDKHLAEGGTLFNWHATAAQRAEAFGLTIGLWKPGQTEP